MTTAISTSALVKTFGPVRALDGLDLEVATGEVHGFLGPNGSGKSTTIRVLLGMLRKDGGEVRLFGSDPWSDAADLHPGEAVQESRLPGTEHPVRLGGVALNRIDHWEFADSDPDMTAADVAWNIEPLLGPDHVEWVGEVTGKDKEDLLRHAAALVFPIDWAERRFTMNWNEAAGIEPVGVAAR
mgnify:CR=1 FL=1